MLADEVARERAALARERRQLQSAASRAAQAEASALQRERAAVARQRQLLGRQQQPIVFRNNINRGGRQRQPAFDVIQGVARRRRGNNGGGGSAGIFQQQIRALASPNAGRGVPALERAAIAKNRTGLSLNDRFGGGRSFLQVRGGRAGGRGGNRGQRRQLYF